MPGGLRKLGLGSKKDREIQREIQEKLVQIQLRCGELEHENKALRKSLEVHVELLKKQQQQQQQQQKQQQQQQQQQRPNTAPAKALHPKTAHGHVRHTVNRGNAHAGGGGADDVGRSGAAASKTVSGGGGSTDDGYKTDSDESTIYSDSDEADEDANDSQDSNEAKDGGRGLASSLPAERQRASSLSYSAYSPKPTAGGSSSGTRSDFRDQTSSPLASPSSGSAVPQSINLRMAPPKTSEGNVSMNGLRQGRFGAHGADDASSAALVFQRTPARSPRARSTNVLSAARVRHRQLSLGGAGAPRAVPAGRRSKSSSTSPSSSSASSSVSSSPPRSRRSSHAAMDAARSIAEDTTDFDDDFDDDGDVSDVLGVSLDNALAGEGPAQAVDDSPLRNGSSNSHHATGELAATLSRVPLLKSVSRADLHRLAGRVAISDFEKGDVVIRQGDVGNCMYIIQYGTARVTISSSANGAAASGGALAHGSDPRNGDEGAAQGIEVRQLGEGACFGEKALLEDVPRSANIIAAGKLRCIVVPRSVFIRLQRKIAADAAEAASGYMMFEDALQWRINQAKAMVSASMDKRTYLAAIHKHRDIIENTEWPFPCDFSRLLANMAPRRRDLNTSGLTEGYDSEQFCAACNQAWKDLRRENDVRINGTPMRMGSDKASDALRARLRTLLEQSRFGHVVEGVGPGGDEFLEGGDPVGDALDVLFLVMSRTMHGGDTHAKTAQVFGNRDLILITPNGETAATIHIDIGPGGTLVVTSLNAYKINYMGDANIEALFNVDAQLVERLHCCTTGGGMYTQQRAIKFHIQPDEGWLNGYCSHSQQNAARQDEHQGKHEHKRRSGKESGTEQQQPRHDDGGGVSHGSAHSNDSFGEESDFDYDSDESCEVLTLVVPADKQGGDDISLIRDGKMMTATIPDGLIPGDEFDLMLKLSPEKRRHGAGI